MPVPYWTDALREEAVRRFDGGDSPGVIAQAMGRSRNSISGMLYRAGKQRAGGASAVVMPRPPRAKGSKPPRAPKPAPPLPPQADPVGLMRLTRSTCRWPLGEPLEQQLFCGAPTEGGESYCLWHLRLAYPGHQAERVRGSGQWAWR